MGSTETFGRTCTNEVYGRHWRITIHSLSPSSIIPKSMNNHFKQQLMVSVEEADVILRRSVRDFGTEEIQFENGLGRVLGKPLRASTDLPPFHRVSMDGIAIRY